jgi:hypothetical protein
MLENNTADHIADELNLYFEVMPKENLFFMPIIGLWKPGKIAQTYYEIKNRKHFWVYFVMLASNKT